MYIPFRQVDRHVITPPTDMLGPLHCWHCVFPAPVQATHRESHGWQLVKDVLRYCPIPHCAIHTVCWVCVSVTLYSLHDMQSRLVEPRQLLHWGSQLKHWLLLSVEFAQELRHWSIVEPSDDWNALLQAWQSEFNGPSHMLHSGWQGLHTSWTGNGNDPVDV